MFNSETNLNNEIQTIAEKKEETIFTQCLQKLLYDFHRMTKTGR